MDPPRTYSLSEARFLYDSPAASPPPQLAPPAPLQGFNMGEGMYKTLLGVNVVGHLVCFAGTVIGFLLHQYVPALQLDCGAASL